MGRQQLHLPVIVPATIDDQAAIVALWQDCGLTRPWNDPAADFALALNGAASAILVMRADGCTDLDEAILGSVMVGFDGHRGWVYYLAVAPDRQRGGIGRGLMAAAEDWLRSRGAPKLQLMVREDNVAALGFYEALGLERQKVVTLGRFIGKEGA
jgi:ribosomal protein S18 acetylase RimI-like enzyme